MATQLSFITQMRSGSTRMPNKMLIPFHEGKTIPKIIIEKLLMAGIDRNNIIVATTTNPNDDVLATTMQKNQYRVYRGDENDVLQRFIDAAEYFSITQIIRVCADNPFLDMTEMQKLLSNVDSDNIHEYVSFKVNETPSIKTHFGFWMEYVTLDALKRVRELTNECYYHEHVTNYIYENPDVFKIRFLSPNNKVADRNDIRMTLDTQDDFHFLSEIYDSLFAQYGNKFGIDEIITFIDNNPRYKTLMVNQIKKNTK